MNFIVIDLETTGLSPKTDRIIEIGAVKIVDDQITDTFQTFVQPKQALSEEIIDLTGITPDMLVNAPGIGQAIEMLLAFVQEEEQGQFYWVAHNKDFESSFLNRLLPIQPLWLDTIDIARIVFPAMRYYRLSYLVDTLGIEHRDLHRALADADAAANLLLLLKKALCGLPDDVWREFLAICGNQAAPLAEFCRSQYLQSRKKLFDQFKQPCPTYPTKQPEPEELQYGGIDLDAADYNYKLPLNEISSFFRRLPKTEYETRPEQIQMSGNVAKAFNEKHMLIVEAGTGTGKSLAYLLPAVLYSQQSNQQVIISTNTINLQDQLLNKDIPLLQKELKEKFYSVVIKGRANYICQRKWQNTKVAVSEQTLALHLRIANWLTQTVTGDISELNLWGSDLEYVQEINAASETCFNFSCQYCRNKCYVSKIRQKAQMANLLIVNHSLLLSASLFGNDGSTILPSARHLIIDEAHQLVPVAQRQFSAKLSSAEIRHKIVRLWQRCKIEELLRVLKKIATKTNEIQSIIGKTESMVLAFNKLPEACKELDNITQEFFTSQNRDQYSLRISEQRFDSEIWQPIEDALGNLHYDLKNLAQKIGELLFELNDSSDPFLSMDAAALLQMLQQNISELLSTAQIILDGKNTQTNENYVIWIEKNSNKNDVTYFEWWISPNDIRPLLDKYIYKDKDTAVFTSATIATVNDFNFIQQELGLNQQELTIKSCILQSPFDYEHNALLLLANDIDDYTKASEYMIAQQVAEAIAKLVGASQGRALVLFTSYQQLNAVYAVLKKLLHNSGVQLLAHGISGSRSFILESLKNNPQTCILGVNSFWEGIDVKGDNLSLLIIVRLPFAPPNTPILEARFELIKQEGGNPFRDYSLPQAIIRFKQGFGRLIRSKEDRGVCCVLDQRIWRQKSYGKKFVDALPVMPTKCCSVDEMIDEIKKNRL